MFGLLAGPVQLKKQCAGANLIYIIDIIAQTLKTKLSSDNRYVERRQALFQSNHALELEKLKPVDKIWWTRFILAFVAAGLSSILTYFGIISSTTAIRALLIAILLYVISYYFARYWMRITPDQLPKKRDMIIAGLFPYLVTWFAFWILFNTLLVYLGLIDQTGF